MSAVLPVVAFVGVTLWLRRRQPDLSRPEAALTIAVGTGVYLTISSEVLGLFHALTRGWVMAIWMLPILLVAAEWVRTRSRSGFPPTRGRSSNVDSPEFRHPKLDPVTIALAFVIGCTAAVAIQAPPNNWDAMTYHMSRVMHWIESGSLGFYPSSIPRQLHFALGAELAVAHLQILAGTDRFANLVQFFSMLGSLCCVVLIAKDLGASARTGLLASLIAATVPMSVLQAATTQNDHVAGLWILCFVLFGRRWSTGLKRWDLFRASAALALAILCKTTALIFCAPFLLWFALRGIARLRSRAWRAGVVVIAVVVAVNAGHWARNTGLYGNPLGPFQEGERRYLNDSFSFHSVASNGIRNLALQVATPWQEVNALLGRQVRLAHEAVGLDVHDPARTWFGAWFHMPVARCHEDSQGSPLHVLLFSAVLAAAAIQSAMRWRIGEVGLFVLACVSAALLFCLLLRWQPWHTRLHLPLLMVAAPAVTVLLSRSAGPRGQGAVAVLLTLGAAPCVLSASARPLLGESNIWNTPRRDQYFVNRPQLKESYNAASFIIAATGSNPTGLVLGGDDWEYPLWVLTGGRTGFVHIAVENRSGKLEDGEVVSKLGLVVCTDLPRCRGLGADGGWEVVLERESLVVLARDPGSVPGWVPPSAIR